MKILDWLANLIFGKRIELYDAETNRPVHKIRIRRRNMNENDPYGLAGLYSNPFIPSCVAG